jgi:Opacity protein and related surface antigens
MTRIGLTALAAASALLANAALASGPVTPVEPYVPPIVPMATSYDWTGGYVGLRLGTPLGDNNWAERGVGAESTPDNWGGTVWGLSGGYDVQSGSMVYGAAIDYTGGEIMATSTSSGTFGCLTNACETYVENSLAIRGRVGWAYDRTLFYGTAGLASGQARAQNPGGPALGSDRLNGWTAGLGVEHAVTDNFSVNLEYLFTDLGRLEIPSSCGTDCFTDVSYGTVRLGANFRF